MSKMKHLLRKLHIGGGGLNDPHHGSHRPGPTPGPNPSTNPIPPIQSPPSQPPDSRSDDFSFLEEEFQVQLALAISASSADHRPVPIEDPDESAQIDAAKRISLGCCSASGSAAGDSDAQVELLSLRYWSYNVVNYDEKVMDGFYDVYGIQSSAGAQGKMPLLVDLQAISILDGVDYEVILVNRLVDPELQKLEKRAMAMAMESQGFEFGSVICNLVQRIADMVVERMGGPVCDADEMVRKWNTRSYELRCSLNTVILPLGRLDVGLSRHRALLFKVLADKIDLPCKLVKGSYYTGTDDGAVNLIKFDTGSEYIIDLMGAPGTLIPAEVPSIYLPSTELEVRPPAEISPIMPDQVNVTPIVEDDLVVLTSIASSKPSESPIMSYNSKQDNMSSAEKSETERFEHEFGKLLPMLPKSCESTSSISVKATPAQRMKVKNVSKYVISAAKNPEFAQKLHAVLLESGASPPPDLFSDTDVSDLIQQKAQKPPSITGVKGGVHTHFNQDKFFFDHEQSLPSTGVRSVDNSSYGSRLEGYAGGVAKEVNKSDFPCSDVMSDGFVLLNGGSKEFFLDDALGTVAVNSQQRQVGNASTSGTPEYIQETEPGGNCFFMDDGSGSKLVEREDDGMLITCNGQVDRINRVLGNAAELDIQWEDLQIGERIGIGSYGEVYRAEWNGTEVAVKKFLDQDFSGEALVQFKCEVEIMLRLRHPNVVLFMGAVTSSPHFSILTEFLPRGSLYRLLHRPNNQLDEKRRLRMALDVAKGMNYLHTSCPTIVHRDLKSPNLLVDKNWTIKVCDFGLSRLKHHTFLSSKSTAGTPEWMAPEVLRNELANEKCDVYSFGVILWELATLSIPWKGLNPMQVVGAVGFQNRRLEIPQEVDPSVAQIIRECWETDPRLRPSFTQIMQRLRRLQQLVVDPTTPTH